MRNGRPAAIGEIVSTVLKKRSLARGLKKGRILSLWPKIVGPELARMTEPYRFERGTLWVRVTDHVLAHQLSYQRAVLLERYAHQLGSNQVTELRFVTGAVAQLEKQKAKPPAAKQKPSLSATSKRRLEQLIAPLPDELKPAARRAGLALAALWESSPRCPVCEAPTEEEGKVCPSCTQRLELPVVRIEAKRLQRNQPPRLEGDLAASARYLARQRLWEQIEALLPEATSTPAYIPHLFELTQAWLRLETGREPRPDDLERLPQPLASLLRRHLGGRG